MKPYNEQIKTARKLAGITQKELSEKTGIYLRQIKFIEGGQSFPNHKNLLAICRVLGISITVSPDHPELKGKGKTNTE